MHPNESRRVSVVQALDEGAVLMRVGDEDVGHDLVPI